MGLYSGETVVDLAGAQQAGYVVTTSNGRVAQLLLRDQQSRPSINVRYFQPPRRNASGSFFGGLMSVFGGGGLLKDVTAVRTRQLHSRGPSDVIVASEHGAFQHWQISWSDGPTFVEEQSAGESMESAAKFQLDQKVPSAIQSVKLVDISFKPKSVRGRNDESGKENYTPDMIGLLLVAGLSYTSYAICAIDRTTDGEFSFDRMILLDSYGAPLQSDDWWKPRICIPASSQTAVVLFAKAIIPVSIATLLGAADSNGNVAPFQDTVYLKDTDGTHIVGVFTEGLETTVGSSIVLFISQLGPLQMVANEPRDMRLAIQRHPISIQSKIEQVVLYGHKPSNPFDLSRRPESSFSREDVEAAAIEVSDNILSCNYSDLAPNPVAMESSLQRRGQFIEALAHHMKDAYPGLSRVTKWKLCWNGEKLATAREIWQLYMQQMEKGKGQSARMFLVPELVELLNESVRTLPEGSEAGRIDQLRQFFFRDVAHVGYVVTWTYGAIHHLAEKLGYDSGGPLFELAMDANDVVCQGLDAAYGYRTENAWLYGLGGEELKDGVLQSGYEGLPEFWTATYQGASKLAQLLEGTQSMLMIEREDAEGDDRQPTDSAIMVAQNTPRLFAAWARLLDERYRWLATISDPEYQKEYHNTRPKYLAMRTTLLERLSKIDQAVPGMDLAEGLEDMKALTKLIQERSQQLAADMLSQDQRPPGEVVDKERERLQKKEKTAAEIVKLEERIGNYCAKHGYAFTNPYFSSIVEKQHFGTLLAQADKYCNEVGNFLHAEPSRRQLAWIHDVTKESDFTRAGQTLMDLATTSQSKAWDRSVELAFAKLAVLAGDEETSVNSQTQADGQPRLPLWGRCASRHAHTSTLLSIQHRLWEHVRHLTYASLDSEGEVQLLMETLGRKLKVARRNALHSLLEQDMEMLVQDQTLNAELLVDVLTTMTRTPADREDNDISGLEFYYALLAVQNDDELSPERKDTLAKMIWRRAMLADDDPLDWSTVNHELSHTRMSDADVKDMLRQTTLYRTMAEGYRHQHTDHHSRNQGDADQGDSMDTESDHYDNITFMNDMPVTNPRDCLIAGTTSEDWLARFGEDKQDLAEPFADECRVENDLLASLITEDDLIKWWEACKATALEDVGASNKTQEVLENGAPLEPRGG